MIKLVLIYNSFLKNKILKNTSILAIDTKEIESGEIFKIGDHGRKNNIRGIMYPLGALTIVKR